MFLRALTAKLTAMTTIDSNQIRTPAKAQADLGASCEH